MDATNFCFTPDVRSFIETNKYLHILQSRKEVMIQIHEYREISDIQLMPSLLRDI